MLIVTSPPNASLYTDRSGAIVLYKDAGGASLWAFTSFYRGSSYQSFLAPSDFRVGTNDQEYSLTYPVTGSWYIYSFHGVCSQQNYNTVDYQGCITGFQPVPTPIKAPTTANGNMSLGTVGSTPKAAAVLVNGTTLYAASFDSVLQIDSSYTPTNGDSVQLTWDQSTTSTPDVVYQTGTITSGTWVA